MGDTLKLPCKTTKLSGVEWTQNTTTNGTNGYFRHIYSNGHVKGNKNILLRFSVDNSSRGEYSLEIYNVHPKDSGMYDCYEADGRRIVGYHLVAKRMFSHCI